MITRTSFVVPRTSSLRSAPLHPHSLGGAPSTRSTLLTSLGRQALLCTTTKEVLGTTKEVLGAAKEVLGNF